MSAKVVNLINIALTQGHKVFILKDEHLIPVLGTIDVINFHEFSDVAFEDIRIVTEMMTAEDYALSAMVELTVPSNQMPVDKQLRHWTGGQSGYNTHDFHNERNEKELTADGIIVHRATGIRFKIPEPA